MSMRSAEPKRWTWEEVNALGADRGFLPAAYWPLEPEQLELPFNDLRDRPVASSRSAQSLKRPPPLWFW
jgi:hypothetical protein